MVECVIGGKTWTYQYGADGLRRRTTVEESGQPTKVTDYVLDGQSVVREFRNEGPWATYLIGARGVEYRQDDTQTGTPREWNVYDGLGSVLATVNAAGVVQEARVVDVYGNPRDGGGPLTGNWFVGGLGHTYDDDPTGLIYMRARWYDPVTGRFVSEDPGRDGVNWYAYCYNNPVNATDATGKFLLLDLMYTKDCVARMELQAWLLANGMKDYAIHKMTEILAGWATRYAILIASLGDDLYQEVTGGEFAVGIDGKFRIMVHVGQALVGNEAPHVQLWIVNVGKVASETL